MKWKKNAALQGPCIDIALLYRVLLLLGSGGKLRNLRGSVGMGAFIPGFQLPNLPLFTLKVIFTSFLYRFTV